MYNLPKYTVFMPDLTLAPKKRPTSPSRWERGDLPDPESPSAGRGNMVLTTLMRKLQLEEPAQPSAQSQVITRPPPPTINFKVVDYSRVHADSKSGFARNFNTAHCRADTLPRPVSRPDVEPYAFRGWLPVIAKLRKLHLLDVQVVHLTRQQARLLNAAAREMILEDEISEGYRARVEELVLPAFSQVRFPPGNKGLFVRLDGCSTHDANASYPTTKDGRTTGLLSRVNILAQLLSSVKAKITLERSLHYGATHIPVYLMPFDNKMNREREYRVFCAPVTSRITAVSQYEWDKPWLFHPQNLEQRRSYPGWTRRTDCQLERRIAEDVLQGAKFVHRQIMAKLCPIFVVEDQTFIRQGFSFDIFFFETTMETQLIELHPFGARSAVRSCLFNWVDDFALLYGEGSAVPEFRVTY